MTAVFMRSKRRCNRSRCNGKWVGTRYESKGRAIRLATSDLAYGWELINLSVVKSRLTDRPDYRRCLGPRCLTLSLADDLSNCFHCFRVLLHISAALMH